MHLGFTVATIEVEACPTFLMLADLLSQTSMKGTQTKTVSKQIVFV